MSGGRCGGLLPVGLAASDGRGQQERAGRLLHKCEGALRGGNSEVGAAAEAPPRA